MPSITPISPRFSAIGIALRHSKSQKQPASIGFIGDYPGYNDGDVVVRSPKGLYHVVVTNNTVVAGVMQRLREEKAFDPDLPPMSTDWLMELVRPAFKELKFIFLRGELPFSHKDGGAELYERLCERPRKESTNTIERLLCEALGYYYTSPSLQHPQRNSRQVTLDLTHEFLQPPKPRGKRQPPPTLDEPSSAPSSTDPPAVEPEPPPH